MTMQNKFRIVEVDRESLTPICQYGDFPEFDGCYFRFRDLCNRYANNPIKEHTLLRIQRLPFDPAKGYQYVSPIEYIALQEDCFNRWRASVPVAHFATGNSDSDNGDFVYDSNSGTYSRPI